MEIIITTLKDSENKNAHYTEDSSAKIKYLEFRNRQLEEENKLLLAMFAEALGRRTVVIREERLERTPQFRIEENMGGDILISVK